MAASKRSNAADGREELLMLVDGNSIVNRAYYAFSGSSRLVTRDGFPTNAIYGFLSIFQKYYDELNPTHVCVAFDMRVPTFRHKEYDQYKAGRKGMPDDLAAQLPALKTLIGALGYRRAECEGYEADDILGTLSLAAERAGVKCAILTGDRDSLQLVSPMTTVYLPVTRAGQTRTEKYDETAILEKYGVPPPMCIEIKGLMGDSSDNIPGVSGVGEKTAIELVGKLGGLDSIYGNLDAVEKKSLREKLAAGKESAYLSRRLATIVRDAPCGLAFSDLEIAKPNRGELYRLFVELQFQTHILKMGLTAADVIDDTQQANGGGAPGWVSRTYNGDIFDGTEQTCAGGDCDGAAPAYAVGGPDGASYMEDGDAPAGGVPTLPTNEKKQSDDNIFAGYDKPLIIINERSAFFDFFETLAGAASAAADPVTLVIYPIFEKADKFRQELFGAVCAYAGGAVYFETEDGRAIRARGSLANKNDGDVSGADGAGGGSIRADDGNIRADNADNNAGGESILADNSGNNTDGAGGGANIGFDGADITNDSAAGAVYPVALSDVFDAFRPVFSHPNIGVTGHDVKQISRWLLEHGEKCPAYGFDTMLGAYVVDAAYGDYALSDIYFRMTGYMLESVDEMRGKGKSRMALSDFGPEELAEAVFKCAKAAGELAPALKRAIADNGQEDLFYNIELPLSEVLASMEVAGFRVDVAGLREFSAELDGYIGELAERIFELAGERFNINSTKQLGAILYEKLGLKAAKKTKTGYSTDADALADLAGKHPIIEKILDYRQHVKLKSTYTDGLIDLINPADGRIHTTLNQAVTATGRISSTEPNLQNIPVRLALGREIRRLFVPGGEGLLLLGADYSQIELRVLAHISEDAGLAEAFQKGQDIHRSTAARVFNVPENAVTDEMRTRAKAVNFGIVYGIGDFSLARDIGVTRKEAREYIDSYLDKYEGVRRYMKDTVAQSKATGFTYTLLHRRRSLSEINAQNFNTRAFGERVAMNTPVQGSAADIIKIAMVRVYDEIKSRGLKSKLILQVHDELIIEAYEDELDEAARILRGSMEQAMTLTVPLVADVYYGGNWKDIKANKA